MSTEPLLDPALVDAAAGMILDSQRIGEALDRITARRLDRQIIPSAEDREEDEGRWNTRAIFTAEFIDAVKAVAAG